MATNERFDEAVSKWLEEAAPARLPERVLEATFERTRRSRQHVGWRALLGRLSMPRFVPALGSAVAVVVAGALALNFFANQQGGPGSSASATPIVSASPSPVDLGIFEPVAGRIVYYSGGPSLWAVDPNAPADSATRVELTSEAGTPLGWSSDGTRLLIMRGSSGEEQLFVLHADGSETQVTERPITMIRSAAISPDGSRVVFVGSTDTPGGECCGPWALYAVDADGGPAEMLAESRTGILDDLSFSPDGTRIAYADGAGDHSHSVWLMDADGSDSHQIVSNEWTAAAGHVRGLAWSPAGDRLAIAIEGTIYTFAPDGSEFTQVISGHRPYWSPDGSQFAYTISCMSNPNGCGLAVADADGSNVRTFRFGGASGPWHPGTRSPSVESTTPPSPTVERTAVPSIPSSMWPQSTLEEAKAAQELADAFDPRYRWQVAPDLAAHLGQGGPYREQIFARFLEEELGWEEFRSRNGGGPMFIRCAPDLKNPFYPDDPNGSCAPTIDEFRYETVQINVAQPIRQDDTGIWVVTEWEVGEPYEQLAPLSEAQTATLLNGFLQARIDGEGAEEYVRVLMDGPEIPFLYATPSGAPYERYEFEVANGPMWPDGQMRLRVRLFADDGDTVVEQLMLLERYEQGLWYESYSHWVEPGPGTTVNGQAVPADLGIFAPLAGRIVYGYQSGIRGVDPAAPADPATWVQLTSGGGTPLGWSSDGTRLLMMRGGRGEERLFVIRADGSETQVTEPSMMLGGASISPDGSRVVFVGGTGQVPGGADRDCCTRWALYAVDADGGPAEMLHESRFGILSNPTFAPDGTQIAYADGVGDHGHSVWLVDADGSSAHQILANETTDAPSHVRGLAWSPAGDRIALGLEGTTYTFAIDGSGFTRVTIGDQPYWSPDGSQVVSGPWHPRTPENGAGG